MNMTDEKNLTVIDEETLNWVMQSIRKFEHAGAPPAHFDPTALTFSWRDVFPDRFFNMDTLDAIRNNNRGHWPVFTPIQVAIIPMYNPSEGDGAILDAEWKPVMYFKETRTGWAINKTNCEAMERVTGTPNPLIWAKRINGLRLLNGVIKRRQQITFEIADKNEALPPPASLEDINQDLFS